MSGRSPTVHMYAPPSDVTVVSSSESSSRCRERSGRTRPVRRRNREDASGLAAARGRAMCAVASSVDLLA